MVIIISSHDQHFLTDGNAKGAMMIVIILVMMDCWPCSGCYDNSSHDHDANAKDAMVTVIINMLAS